MLPDPVANSDRYQDLASMPVLSEHPPGGGCYPWEPSRKVEGERLVGDGALYNHVWEENIMPVAVVA